MQTKLGIYILDQMSTFSACIHSYIHAYLCALMQTKLEIYWTTWAHFYARICFVTCRGCRILTLWVSAYPWICVYVCVRAYICVCVCVRVCRILTLYGVCLRACMYLHTHIHTQQYFFKKRNHRLAVKRMFACISYMNACIHMCVLTCILTSATSWTSVFRNNIHILTYVPCIHAYLHTQVLQQIEH